MILRALILLSLPVWAGALLPDLDVVAPVDGVPAAHAVSVALAEAAAPADSSVMAFESLSASFGTVKDDSGEQTLSYRFVNNSGRSLAIAALVPTCPCMKATSDKSTYAEGAEGTISIVFNPWRMSGNVDLKVLVYTELLQNAPTAVLRVGGEVVAADPWDYLPIKAGKLRLKSDKATFAAGEKVVRILCANISNKILQPAVDLVPDGVDAHFEPAVIAPQSEADLVVKIERPVPGAFTVSSGERDIKIIKLIYEDE